MTEVGMSSKPDDVLLGKKVIAVSSTGLVIRWRTKELH